MTEQQLAKWRAAKLAILAKPLSRKCPYCGAGIGQPCILASGKLAYDADVTHVARLSLNGSNRRYG
jgi:hypothetical protein